MSVRYLSVVVAVAAIAAAGSMSKVASQTKPVLDFEAFKAKVQPIADFSELGHFLDMPVRYYSSGMKVRLAFSIATAIEPEILLVDEVLSVGDMAFQDKARVRMQEMLARAQLIVLVSHDLDSIVRLCHRVVWMDHGRIRMDGDPKAVADAYVRSVEAPQVQAA